MYSRFSIRGRITVGSVAVALVLLAVALFVVRAQVGAILTNADTSLAQSDLASFQKDISAHPDESVDDPGTGVLVYVRSPAGETQVNTLPHDLVILVERREPTHEQYTTTDDEGRSFVVVGRTVSTDGGTWALWSARSTSASQLALSGLDRVLIIGGILLLAGFGLAAWLLATAALRPVNSMRRKAAILGADNASGDLPVGPAHDELSALANTLNDLLSRVRESAAREKQMVSDAAHELRTPLAALKTQLELAHSSFGDAGALASRVTAAEASVDRLASLTVNLLELSRLEAPDAVARTSRASELMDEFTGSVDRARLVGLAKSADLSFELDVPDEAATYAIDRQAFGRLSDNLLTNAVHAVGVSGSIVATLYQTVSMLTLEVVDNGPGMPADFLPHAFDRFSRPDSARATSAGGSGLGLALVRALAKAGGGDAVVRNIEGGFAASITLPKM